MTAPLAVIKIDGIAVGKIKNIRATENYQRGDVRGLGEITSQEKPALSFNGTFSMSWYTIDLKKLGTVKNPFINRVAGDINEWSNTFMLNETPIDIFIYKKGAKTTDETTGIVTEIQEEDFAVIKNCFIDSQNFVPLQLKANSTS